MLIQGTNVPIKLVFSSSMATMDDLVATLWNGQGKEMKRWNMEDMTIDGVNVYLPLEESETAKYPTGKVKLEIKGVSSGKVVFWEEKTIVVKERKDRVVDFPDID